MNLELSSVISNMNEYLDRYLAFLRACGQIEWDMLTGAPKGGTVSRSKTLGILAEETFKLQVSDQMRDFLSAIEPSLDKLDINTRAVYRICKKNYDDSVKVPAELIREYEEHTMLSNNIWENAKNTNDFALFEPSLQKTVELVKKISNYRGYSGHPYDLLLEDYEPGMTIEKLDAFFAELKQTIVPLLKAITEHGKKIDCSFLTRPVSIEKQKQISDLLMRIVGYDLNRGQLKESEHPVTIDFGRDDVRITTHYFENAFLSSLFSVLHESGHGIYEQNKSDDIANTILDSGISNGIHESQSRFYENVIGRSEGFWNLIYPELMKILGDDFSDVTPKMLYEASNIAQPSLIRVEADELTYSLHIMVRYELEKQLFGGEIEVHDLPKLWNQKYEEYLGITPLTDSEGVLQDVHWSGGMFGYFPSYALGNAYSAQLLAYMQREFDVEGEINLGNISKITEWLKDKIHRFGSVYIPVNLIGNIAGEGLNAKYYTDYLKNKFEKLYQVTVDR